MEMILFCGIQATGKTTFFKERFFKTHIRISMDQLHTRNKENKFIETCFATQHPFVIDNTNPLRREREKYMTAAKQNKYRVIGYYFQSNIGEALERNSKREGKERIPDVGVKGTYSKLEIPSWDEGFDELYFVEVSDQGFNVKNWKHEV
jgi:predicted kinase